MSGYVLPAIPKRLIDYATLVSGTEDVILADRLSVPSWREVTLLVQIYNHTLGGTSNTIDIRVHPQSWTLEEPGLVFIDPTPLTILSVSSATSSPGYLEVAIPTTGTPCIGHMAYIVARGTRNTAGAFNATFSVEFSTKDA